MYDEENNILCCAGQDKSPLCWHDVPKEPTKEEPLSYVLQESPVASVSTVSRGPPLSGLSESLVMTTVILDVLQTVTTVYIVKSSYSAVQEVKTTNTLQSVY